MKPEKQEARRRQIEAAAYEVLGEKGYGAASMLSIAKRAAASNETLYKWYGNKQTLFASLVEANAREVTALLQGAIDEEANVAKTIARLGPALLGLVTGEKAVMLNRAAAADADDTGILGQTLARSGRDAVAPLVAQVFEQARSRGELVFDETEDVVEVYLCLLIGDLQIRRVTGAVPALSDRESRKRAERAWQVVLQLYGRR